MKALTTSILLLFFTLSAFAQTTISGYTKDNKGRPVAGVSISIKDSYDGSTSDSTGKYSFKTTETGDKFLVASSIGFTASEQKINLTGALLTVNLVLKEEPNELNAVSITAGTFEASDSKRTTVLNPIDIVTTASANGDVTGAIKTLPGAQQVGESEGLFVRGGTAGETKVFIDGTLVNNFFFSSVPDIAQRGRFSPFLFKGTVFSSGGYSAQYGQALSSVLLLESIDLPEKSSANLGISSVGLSGGYQHLAGNKKSSWGITYNYTNLLPSFKAIKQKPDYFQVPEFHNSDFNYRLKTSATGMLKFYGYFNASRLGLRRPDIDSAALKDAFDLKNINFYSNLSWKEKLGQHWRMNLGMSYSTNTDKILNELQDAGNSKQTVAIYPFSQKNFSVRSNGQLATGRAVFERRLKGISMFLVGGEYTYNRDNSDYSADSITHSIARAADHFKAAFAETDIYVTNDLAAKIGTRVEHSSLLGKADWVPRVSLAYKLGNAGQASLAYGVFYQKPDNSFFIRNYRFTDLGYTKATHYIANFQKVSRDYTLRAELFYKKYEDLVKTVYLSSTNSLLNNKGYGFAQGFELFWRDKKTIRNLDYWVSYSYLDTRRDYLNYPASIQPNFAARHTASLVVKKFITPLKTQFNGSYTFATGRPYYNIQYDYGKNQYRIFDQGKTISYNNVGFSVNYLPNLNKQGASKFTVFVFSVSNVLGNKQVFGYNYSYKGVKDAVTPPANRFFFLGCFLSFGVDRSEDIINNNL
ncbi:MAG: TonB-dependent receptor [Williamsia sp.]|nr:TonB-dependent receptor [Williamsia sp.]